LQLPGATGSQYPRFTSFSVAPDDMLYYYYLLLIIYHSSFIIYYLVAPELCRDAAPKKK
jgi:hypothetical protein